MLKKRIILLGVLSVFWAGSLLSQTMPSVTSPESGQPLRESSGKLELLRPRTPLKAIFDKKRGEIEEKQKKVSEFSQERKQKMLEQAQKIKDERKREILQRIAERLNYVNQKWVEIAKGHLERLSVILDRLEEIAYRFRDKGVDISNTLQALDEARAKIVEALERVDEQATKVYEYDIEGLQEDPRLGEAIRGLILALKSDLQDLREELKEAREAVINVHRTLKEDVRRSGGMEKGEKPESSPSPEETSQE